MYTYLKIKHLDSLWTDPISTSFVTSFGPDNIGPDLLNRIVDSVFKIYMHF